MGLEMPDWFGDEFLERLKKLELRKRINNNPRAVIGISLACLFILFFTLLGIFAGGRPSTSASNKVWFYDLNTGELFTTSKELSGPIEAPSGPLANGQPGGVKAYVMSYVEEPDESERFIGFLEKPDPNYTGDRSIAEGTVPWGSGKLIRTVEDANWVSATSFKGKAIYRKAFGRNEKGQPALYVPPR